MEVEQSIAEQLQRKQDGGCAQNHARSPVCGEERSSRPFLQQILLDLNRRDGAATEKCNLSHGRARGILDADDYSLATRASL
jgi:hypothetical protein